MSLLSSSELNHRLSRIRLVVMDIDGTLVSSDGRSIDPVLQRLRQLRQFDIQSTLATGRSVAGAKPFALYLQQQVDRYMPPVITYNGAVVIDYPNNIVIAQQHLSSSTVDHITRLCQQRDLQPLAYTCKLTPSGQLVEHVYADLSMVTPTTPNFAHHPPVEDLTHRVDPVSTILFGVADPQTCAKTVAEFSALLGEQACAMTSSGQFVELYAPGVGKHTALAALLRREHLSRDQVLAIGDNLNDIGMLQYAGLGVAVANAQPETKAAADYVTRHTATDGVVELLDRLQALYTGLQLTG